MLTTSYCLFFLLLLSYVMYHSLVHLKRKYQLACVDSFCCCVSWECKMPINFTYTWHVDGARVSAQYTIEYISSISWVHQIFRRRCAAHVPRSPTERGFGWSARLLFDIIDSSRRAQCMRFTSKWCCHVNCLAQNWRLAFGAKLIDIKPIEPATWFQRTMLGSGVKQFVGILFGKKRRTFRYKCCRSLSLSLCCRQSNGNL